MSLELFARRQPPGAAQRIDHAPPRRNLQPSGWAGGDVGPPTFERGCESLLDAGFDKIEAARAKRARERRRDRGRVLSVECIDIDHAKKT